MTDSYIKHHAGGGTSIVGPDAMALFRAVSLKSSLQLYQKTGLIPTRGVTLTVMLKLAGQYSGKTYKRTEIDKAKADLQKWIDTMKAALPIEHEGEKK